MMSSVFLLIVIGIAELYSIAHSNGGDDLDNFKKQLLFVIIGSIILFILLLIDFQNLASYSRFLYFIGAAALIGVLFFGKVVNGTQGWYQIGSFTLQPVEFVKVITIIFLAKYFSTRNLGANSIRHILFSGLGVGLFCILVMRQPDFGSAMILGLLWFIMLIASGVGKKYIISMITIFLLLLMAGWFFFFQDYQKDRILTFLNPQEGSLKEGYNINQAIIAIGSGGLFGRGIGFGSQSQLKFLPETESDFIFAVTGEQLGFLGASLVIVLFTAILLRIINFAKNDIDRFSQLIMTGITSFMLSQFFINIGMNMGIVPVTGITLPLVSYGGSSLVSTLFLLGIIFSIRRLRSQIE